MFRELVLKMFTVIVVIIDAIVQWLFSIIGFPSFLR